jgi:DNA-binding MurR/RpiR family transcriptional regulator
LSDLADLSFPDRLRGAAERLTDADTKAVRAILEDPRRAALFSVGDLAERAGVHEATATRLAQKLGYKGFPAMREALQAHYIAGADGAARVARSVGRVKAGGYLADLVASEIDALAALAGAVSQVDLDALAGRVMAARRVFLFARGHALALADLAERRLRRFGRDVVMLAGEDRTIAERLAGLGATDLVIVFAFRAPPRGMDVVHAHARSVGAGTALLADLAAAATCPAFDVALAAPRGRSGDEFQTLTIPMAILNALILTIGGRHETMAIGALDTVSGLIRRLDT